MNCGTLRSLLSVPSTPLKHWLGTRQMGAAEVLICLIASSTTRRTSARHQRPSGFFVAHWHPPIFFSSAMRFMIVEVPFSMMSFSMSAALYPKQ